MNLGLVDDHTIIRNGIRLLLESLETYDNIDVTLEADNGLDMIKKITEMKKDHLSKLPDVILLDITMPEMDGFETAEWLKSNYPNIKIIILTMRKDIESIEKMINIGVNSYLTKDSGLIEIQEAIKTVQIGQKFFSNSIANILVNSFLKEKEISDTETKLKLLTPREISYIELLVQELTHSEIASMLSVSLRTVDSYKESVMAKLKVKTKIGIVAFAVKNDILNL